MLNCNVYFSRSAAKQVEKLNKRVITVLDLLTEELREHGPYPGKHWPNYGKMKGRPTWVCCWEVIDQHKKIIEVYYVGSHEKAPY